MQDPFENWDLAPILATLIRLFEIEGDNENATLLRDSSFRTSLADYDNWNGGQYFYSVTLEVAPSVYAALADGREATENYLAKRIGDLSRASPNEFLKDLIILPSLEREVRKPPPLLAQPKFWKEGKLRVFFSHQSEIKVQASSISKILDGFGISGFVAHEDIEPTKEWLGEIDLALNTMDALVALLSSSFHTSVWTDQEVGIGIGRGVLIVPVMIDMMPYGFLGRYQAYKGYAQPDFQVAKAIFEILMRHPQTSYKMASCLINDLEVVGSWEEARRVFALIETCPGLNKDLSNRILTILEKNEKVKEAWGVPEKAKAIAAKFGG